MRGTTCPRCKAVVLYRRDGSLRVHKSSPHGYCTASGLTHEEISQGLTALRKQVNAHLASKAQGQTPPTEGDQMT